MALRSAKYNAEEAARRYRWTAASKSRVTHPKYGSVVVPHRSKLCAMENAAEFWRCDVTEIIGLATVEWVEKKTPVRKPMEFCKERKQNE